MHRNEYRPQAEIMMKNQKIQVCGLGFIKDLCLWLQPG